MISYTRSIRGTQDLVTQNIRKLNEVSLSFVLISDLVNSYCVKTVPSIVNSKTLIAYTS